MGARMPSYCRKNRDGRVENGSLVLMERSSSIVGAGLLSGAPGCRSAGPVRQPQRRRKTGGGSTLDGSFFGSLVGMSVRLRNFADQSERNRPIPMSKPPRISTLRRFVVAIAFVACFLALHPRPAAAWGDEGHEIIALVAERPGLTGIGTQTATGAVSITSRPTGGTSSILSLPTRTSIEPASAMRRYQPAQLHRMARPELASSIKSSNSPPSLPTPAPIPRNGRSR